MKTITNKLNLKDVANSADNSNIRITLTPGLHPNAKAEKVLDMLKAQEVRIDMVWTGDAGWRVTAELWHGLDENHQDIESTLVPWMSIANAAAFERELNRKLKGVLSQMRQEYIDFNPPWLNRDFWDEIEEAEFEDVDWE